MPNPRALAKVLGVAASAAGVGALAQPEQAEAMPVGVVTKATKIAKGAVSSSSKALKGWKVAEKTIHEVRKGLGPRRALVFDDGTQMVMTKDEITDLCRSAGREKYTDTFRQHEGLEPKTIQALKSLRFHYSRADTVMTRSHIRMLHKEHLKKLKEMKAFKETEPTVFATHRGASGLRFFSMPKPYAELLEGMGKVRIMKTPRDIQALKGLRE